MSKQETQNPYDLARQVHVIKERVFDPEAPKVKTEQVIVVSIPYGDGSSRHPAGYKEYYYRKDGILIGELK